MTSDSLLSHLECSACGQRHAPEASGACAECAAPLLCRYDLERLDSASWPGGADRAGGSDEGVFRWSALLPVRDPARRLSLGEGDTPLVDAPRLAEDLDLGGLSVLCEGQNPLGSFKARGLAVAVAAHVERGARAITLPSAGNAGGAAAAYARRHGIDCRVVLPSAASPTYRAEARLLGARVIAVTGDLGAAGRWVAEHPPPEGDHVIATFREPFRLEGKKTMGFDLWLRLGESLPDAIVYPTGGGTGLIAFWKAFDELRAAGLLQRKSPRLLAAQVEACAPLARAWDRGDESVEPWSDSRRTLAEGLRVPAMAGGALALRALRETNGLATAIGEPALLGAARAAARRDGLLLSPEGAVALATLQRLRERSDVAPGARVVVVDTAHPYKSAEMLAASAAG